MATRTQVVSASRAGVASVVVTDDTTSTKMTMVVGVGVEGSAATTVAPGATATPALVVVMA